MLHVVEQALGVPMKRFERRCSAFLSREEMLAIIGKPGSPDQSARSHAPAHALQHRARVSEIMAFAWPMSCSTARLASTCMARAQTADDAAVAINGQGDAGLVAVEPRVGGIVSADAQPGRHAMTRTNVAQRFGLGGGGSNAGNAELAGPPHLPAHHSPHDRHAICLQSGEPIDGIALCWGIESRPPRISTTEANLEMKQKALAKLLDPDTAPNASRPPLAVGVLKNAVIMRRARAR